MIFAGLYLELWRLLKSKSLDYRDKTIVLQMTTEQLQNGGYGIKITGDVTDTTIRTVPYAEIVR